MFANDFHQFIVVLNELTVSLYTLLNRIKPGIELVIEGYVDPHLFPALTDMHTVRTGGLARSINITPISIIRGCLICPESTLNWIGSPEL